MHWSHYRPKTHKWSRAPGVSSSKVHPRYLVFHLYLSSYRPSGPMVSYLRVSGTKIVDGDGKEVVLRGAGLGGWMK